jgi:chromosome segregation ATPase
MVYELPTKHRTWQPWLNEIHNQIADNENTLSLLTNQLEELTKRRDAARMLLAALPNDHRNEAERKRCGRLLTATVGSEEMIAKKTATAQTRLDHWNDQLTHFDTAALRAEEKLAATRRQLGHLPHEEDAINSAKAESGSVSHYGG